MIYVEPVEFPGIDKVLENADYYKDKLINESVICFRNANLTERDQFDFAKKIGKLFGFYLINDESKYIENHERKSEIVSGPDDIIVEWHVEHTYYVNPIVASTWNMYNFKTDNENGKTYFVDTNVVFEMLTDDEKQFLLDSRITEPDFIKEAQLKNGFASGTLNFADNYPIVAEHWLTGKPIIRFTILPKPAIIRLVSYKAEMPTQDEITYFETLIRKIEDIIWNNEDVRIVHKWQQGDLVIPDMFKLAHAVTGGFKPEDREFRGIWGYRYEFGTV
jgi:alpha-ketoglutarate-dependent taurine dioxygenase